MSRISAPTPHVWVIGRTKTDGPPDYDAVHKIQAGYKVTMLSDWGKTPRPVEVKIDPSAADLSLPQGPALRLAIDCFNPWGGSPPCQ
jgi:hypothetical protein